MALKATVVNSDSSNVTVISNLFSVISNLFSVELTMILQNNGKSIHVSHKCNDKKKSAKYYRSRERSVGDSAPETLIKSYCFMQTLQRHQN